MSGIDSNPGGGGANAAGLSDLEQLQLKANAVTDESLESTRRMMRLVEESHDSGAKTMEALNQQGEQLERIEGGLDKINADMQQAQKHLTGMEKWCGLCVCPWNRAKKIKDVDDSIWENKGDGTVVRKQPGKGNDQSDAERNGPYIQRITNDAREDEMEDNMQAVGSILGNLKSMATDMGNEIEKQNKQLDTIGTKTAGADIMINHANKRTEKLLK
eukprot:TRINITY_DN9542_c0_g1_i3.p1 TRINITY_DN9542_c0_g1~~TRINITY_DN9542_c0_g1_i3.p1  ORF type:complete len:229 (+),score=72.90 TRINITY_DN9542_c0_g1_i3:42-689(+)